MTFIVPNSGGKEKFEVHNYEDNYSGITTLRSATTFSDNSVYAQVGIQKPVGVKKVARLARRMGIRTPVSANYALTLGAPKQGFTVLDMAHAYLTLATGGKLRYGRLSPDGKIPGPSGIAKIEEPKKGKYRLAKLPDGKKAEDKLLEKRVLPQGVADQATSILSTVVKQGTGKRADLGKAFAAGKTGTTEDYGDAWFVGYTKDYTVAVWVGYPDEVKPMKPPNFSFQGEPVAGGTYPAVIWKTFMAAVIKAQNERKLKRAREKALKEGKPVPNSIDELDDPTLIPPVGGATTTAPATAAPATGDDGGGGGAPDEEPDRETERARPQDAAPDPAEPEPEDPGATAPAPTQAPATPTEPPGAPAPVEGGAVPPG